MIIKKDFFRGSEDIPFEKREVFRDEGGGFGETLSKFRGVFFLQEGEEFVSDLVSQEEIGEIGPVRAERELPRGKVVKDFRSRSIEQRADQHAIFRSHGGESS